jgi:hypothetical protein
MADGEHGGIEIRKENSFIKEGSGRTVLEELCRDRAHIVTSPETLTLIQAIVILMIEPSRSSVSSYRP